AAAEGGDIERGDDAQRWGIAAGVEGRGVAWFVPAVVDLQSVRITAGAPLVLPGLGPGSNRGGARGAKISLELCEGGRLHRVVVCGLWRRVVRQQLDGVDRV